jgi:hypothetical protein
MIVLTIFAVALVINAVALVINLGHYVRNFEVFGSPIAPPSHISQFTSDFQGQNLSESFEIALKVAVEAVADEGQRGRQMLHMRNFQNASERRRPPVAKKKSYEEEIEQFRRELRPMIRWIAPEDRGELLERIEAAFKKIGSEPSLTLIKGGRWGGGVNRA